MNTINSQKSIAFLMTIGLVGMLLTFAPFGAKAELSLPGGRQVNIINSTPGSLFNANATRINGTTSYNIVGVGGNDTFILAAGNYSTSYVATGLFNNTFIINSTGGGNSTFSLSSGANSTFIIQEGNLNGTVNAAGGLVTSTQEFAISGGIHCVVNESSFGPVDNAIWSINLGTNSTVSLGSAFAGNETSINVVF